jgi:hypothetical protein
MSGGLHREIGEIREGNSSFTGRPGRSGRVNFFFHRETGEIREAILRSREIGKFGETSLHFPQISLISV